MSPRPARNSLSSSGCLGTHSHPPASASGAWGLQVCITLPGLTIFLISYFALKWFTRGQMSLVCREMSFPMGTNYFAVRRACTPNHRAALCICLTPEPQQGPWEGTESPLTEISAQEVQGKAKRCVSIGECIAALLPQSYAALVESARIASSSVNQKAHTKKMWNFMLGLCFL